VPALKGAFVKLDAGLLGGLPNIILFQFNPETVSRTPGLATPPQPADGSGSTAPDDHPIAAASGILPALSAMELLMYPSSSLASQLFGGGAKPHKSPPEKLPTVLFFWGPFRLVPVTVTNLYVQETQYDQLLNPIRAEVSVSLQVLTPVRLPKDATFARGAYEYTQTVREVMAVLNLANMVVGAATGSLPVL
jgi:hypothetical protein